MQLKVTTRIALIALAIPFSAHAFIDERTAVKKPAPAPLIIEEVKETVSIPAASKPTTPIAATALFTKTETITTAPQPVSVEKGVRGDVSSPVWSTPYPGPYGSMALADALIAQVVPAVGGAISLSGEPELLSTQVMVPQGMSRINTLKKVAEENDLGILIQGKNVSLIGSPIKEIVTKTVTETITTPTITTTTTAAAAADSSEAIRITEQTFATAVAGKAEGAIALPVTPTTKSWMIPVGVMLSSAMLDWAQQWGWTVIWQADIDFRIAAPIHLNGTFLNGVSEVLEAYSDSNRPLWGDWQEQQKILVIREPSPFD